MPEQPVQRSEVDVANMSAEQISRALHAGELSEYLAGRDQAAVAEPESESASPTTSGPDQGAREGRLGQIGEDELRTMTPEQIVAARKAGRLLALGIAP